MGFCMTYYWYQMLYYLYIFTGVSLNVTGIWSGIGLFCWIVIELYSTNKGRLFLVMLGIVD